VRSETWSDDHDELHWNLARPMGRPSAALHRILGHLMAQVLSWHRRRRDRNALMSQPDYLLRDIGIERRDIDAALHSVRVAHAHLIGPTEWRAVDGIVTIN